MRKQTAPLLRAMRPVNVELGRAEDADAWQRSRSRRPEAGCCKRHSSRDEVDETVAFSPFREPSNNCRDHSVEAQRDAGKRQRGPVLEEFVCRQRRGSGECESGVKLDLAEP